MTELSTTAVYVHFPWCVKKCDYCDFFSIGLDSLCNRPPSGSLQVPDSQLRRYEVALFQELEIRLQDFTFVDHLESIYFGGGTASLLPPDVIFRVIERLRQHFQPLEEMEITLEGNPEHLTPDYLNSLHQVGVNRINAGIQTFHGETLESIGRYSDPERYSRVMEDLIHSPFENFGVDLIYGLPGQSRDRFLEDLNRVLTPELKHLSLYSLTAEPHTCYDAKIEQKLVPPPDETLQMQLFQELPGIMKEKGFEHYEVSNYARPGFECRHNLRYWLYSTYMGLGPSAHGFTGSFRWANPASVEEWFEDPDGAVTTLHEPWAELPLMMLRLTSPISLELFERKASTMGSGTIAGEIQSIFQKWCDQGLGVMGDGGETFTWKMEGLLNLDEHVLEMATALERAVD